MSNAKAALDWKRPLQTRDGVPMECIGINRDAVYSRICRSKVNLRVTTYTEQGYLHADDPDDSRNIINVPESAEAVDHTTTCASG